MSAIYLKDLVESGCNVRKEYLKETVKDLAESIQRDGLMNRIVVRPSTKTPGKFEVLAGGRRAQALRDIYGDDHEVSPNDLIIKRVDDFEALSISISENVQRIGFSAMELAEAAAKAKTLKPGIKVDEIASLLWTTPARVKRLLSLFGDIDTIPETVKEQLSLPDEMEPTFTDAHWDSVRKNGGSLGEEQIKDVCEYIMDKDIPPSRVPEVIARFDQAESIIQGDDGAGASSGAAGEEGPEDPFEEKYKGQLRLADEGGKEVLYCSGKGEDVVIDLEHLREFLLASDKFRVFFQGKVSIKPVV